ncbi:hypothetical protein N0V88_002679 [Collariella sp. IMI 366227]|nr:hypothetical protein N0V88_002679 [Collariella sp. IMI 366227]
MQKVFDAVIIGGGPAGLSAALALARVCRTSVVFDSGEYRNHGVEEMHTYLSRDGTNLERFRATARQQIQDKYSAQVTFIKNKIVRVSNNEITPGYKGHQCPFCDGYEHQSTSLGLLTFPDPSYTHLAFMVRPFAKDSNTMTIFSNSPVPADQPTQTALKTVFGAGYKLDERRITRLVNNCLGAVNDITLEFESGLSVKVGMLFHRPQNRSRAYVLIEQLGLDTKPTGEVMHGPLMETSVRGCFVAGDTQAHVKQVVTAAENGEITFFMLSMKFD